MRYVTLPGIYNSGPTHWQTLWEADDAMVRFEPSDWDEPQVDDWVAAVDAAVSSDEQAVLVAHSLACMLVPIWASRSSLSVAGAFMVAPVDPDSVAFPAAGFEFAGFPRGPLGFPALVVGQPQ